MDRSAKTDADVPFGRSFTQKKKPLPVVTITRGNRSHKFVIRPWVTFISAILLLAAASAYLGATAYLLFRDDIVLATRAHSVRMQENYEDRIAELRKHIDRITSRQLLEQNVVSAELDEILENQAFIAQNSEKLKELIESRGDKTVGLSFTPIPRPNPRRATGSSDDIMTGTIPSSQEEDDSAQINAQGGPYFPLIDAVRSNINETHNFQLRILNAVAAGAQRDLSSVQTALAPLGVRIKTVNTVSDQDTGGPLTHIENFYAEEFFRQYQRAATSIANLESTRRAAQSIPLWSPVSTGSKITSKFGPRLDPFLKKPAMHNGIDYSANTGAPVYASANGIIESAGRNGGYGRAIDIQHSRGLMTRYAHLSRIVVDEGQVVKRGQVIGYAGSTGRSTGPHLHFEIHRSGDPTNPLSYLDAGRKIRKSNS